MRREPLISVVPGSTLRVIVSARVVPAAMAPMAMGSVVPFIFSATDPFHGASVELVIGKVTRTLLPPTGATLVSTSSPPHNELSPRSIVAELRIDGGPLSGMMIVNGVSVAALHVSTWVRPRSDDAVIGIRKTPRRTSSDSRYRRTEGMASVSWLRSRPSTP